MSLSTRQSIRLVRKLRKKSYFGIHKTWRAYVCQGSVLSQSQFLIFKITELHTASFWNITIQWTSHDDLTEKLISLVSLAKLVKWQKCKSALCHLTEKLLVSNFIVQPNLQINLEAKSMHGSSWKKNSIVSEFTLFFAEQVLFTVNGLNWSQSWQVLICLLRKSLNHENIN